MRIGKASVPQEGLAGGTLLFLIFVLVMAIFALVAQGAESPDELKRDPAPDRKGTVMLVRAWDPENGSLTGWLPMHQAEMELEVLDKSAPLHFDPNEAVSVVWLRRPRPVTNAGEVAVSPHPRKFDGERWLPVKRDANLVRIGKKLFLIRRIIFREPSEQPTAKAAAQAGEASGSYTFH